MINIITPKLSFSGGTSLRYDTKYIVLHHAEAQSCTVEQVHQWHLNNGWAGIGYHYFVRKDGGVYRGRPENTIGAQCTNYNSVSIGICAEGAYHDKDTVMPYAQKRALIELIADIGKRYKGLKIVGHHDLMATSCPGKYYPFEEIVKGEIKEEIEEMIYNYIDKNMPEWARPTIQKLVDKGLLKGDENGELGLNDTMLKIFAVNDRAGLYD